jgi:hypothetical protein
MCQCGARSGRRPVELERRTWLPSIRLHDLRHSDATAALASGLPVKVVSQSTGYADVGVTLKIERMPCPAMTRPQ